MYLNDNISNKKNQARYKKQKKKSKEKKDITKEYEKKKRIMSSDEIATILRNNVFSVIKDETKKQIRKTMTYKTMLRIFTCSDFLEMVADRTLEHKKVVRSYNCNNRFCLVCNWRKSRKEATMIAVLMNYIHEVQKKDFIFLTLTAPNVTGENLKDEITKFNLSFKKLFKRKDIMSLNKGYIRKLEVSYNKEPKITEDYYNNAKGYFDRRGLKVGDENPNYNTYHTHFHVVIAVNKSYFTEKTIYLSQEKWLNHWRECMQDDTITQVDIRRVRNVSPNSNAILEISKYTTKATELYRNEETFNTFYDAMKGRQLITYNGLFKDVLKDYKVLAKIKDEEERKKHYLYPFLPKDPNEYVYKLLYAWGFGKYVEKEIQILTEEERKKFNVALLDEEGIETDL